MSIVHSDGLGHSSRTMRHPTHRELLPSGSRNTLLTLDTWPPKSPEMNIIEDIRDALLHAVEKRSPPPPTPMDLLTALQDSCVENLQDAFRH
ncbi:hypothetical protein AVEN_119006-1 [Araneus ventricosus]|uniref:Uncharacterized protein n=1 Tax=Araneus ventricosus TaxID=182803 RepID=A0A4Y2KQ36_ARAVE|nr:hypothetical protein AVEN_119006-1 [Araneus ventricosus]